MEKISSKLINIKWDSLHTWVKQAFVNNGLTERQAIIVADSLVEANLRGIDTHGVILAETYINRLHAKTINIKPNLKIKTHSPVTASLHGDNGFGQITSYKAMKHAIHQAKIYGLATTTVNNSNHFGAAAFYTMMAAEQDCVGFALSNASPRMAPWGGITQTYGNNPWSVAVPYQKDFSIVLDIANSVVAFSKIMTARSIGEKIPDDWALTSEGERTTDPTTAELLLPFGGHKGYGIAFMVEVLAGVLTGASLGKDVGRYNSLEAGQNVGHYFAAIHIPTVIDKKEFQTRLAIFVNQIYKSEKIDGNQNILLPGEKEAIVKKQRIKEGIPLPRELYQYLNQFSK